MTTMTDQNDSGKEGREGTKESERKIQGTRPSFQLYLSLSLFVQDGTEEEEEEEEEEIL